MEFKKPVEIRVMSKKVTLLPRGHEMICHAAACNKTLPIMTRIFLHLYTSVVSSVFQLRRPIFLELHSNNARKIA